MNRAAALHARVRTSLNETITDRIINRRTIVSLYTNPAPLERLNIVATDFNPLISVGDIHRGHHDRFQSGDLNRQANALSISRDSTTTI